jgi:hypothetical protein
MKLDTNSGGSGSGYYSCRVDLQATGLLLMWMINFPRAPPMILVLDRSVPAYAP